MSKSWPSLIKNTNRRPREKPVRRPREKLRHFALIGSDDLTGCGLCQGSLTNSGGYCGRNFDLEPAFPAIRKAKIGENVVDAFMDGAVPARRFRVCTLWIKTASALFVGRGYTGADQVPPDGARRHSYRSLASAPSVHVSRFLICSSGGYSDRWGEPRFGHQPSDDLILGDDVHSRLLVSLARVDHVCVLAAHLCAGTLYVHITNVAADTTLVAETGPPGTR